MQKLFALTLLLFLPLQLFAFDVPEKPTSFVSDYANILTSEQKIELENKISNFEEKTSNEISTVIIKSLDGDNIENVAQQIFDKWGIGKKDKNNGVLILVAIGDRKTRIHTGYGLEGDLTDLQTSYIQNEVIVPAFREGRYYDGLGGAVDQIVLAISGNKIVPEDYGQTPKKSGFNWEFIFIIGFILIQWIFSVLARSKSFWAGGVLGGVGALLIYYFFIHSILASIPVFGVMIGLGLLFDYLVSRAYQKHKDSGGKNPPWFMGGGGFGSGSSGGFGGFGGGSSGGGGSSSNW